MHFRMKHFLKTFLSFVLIGYYDQTRVLHSVLMWILININIVITITVIIIIIIIVIIIVIIIIVVVNFLGGAGYRGDAFQGCIVVYSLREP